ncbi:MAG: hypothetical protein NW703_11150 [Nitrospiraceae bacterium]
MSITRSLEGVVNFMRGNDKLIKDVAEAGEGSFSELQKLANRLEVSRTDTEDLVKNLGQTKFAVEKDQDIRATQEKILQEIGENGKKIMLFSDEPELVGIFHAHRAKLYQALANTYDATVQRVISFNPTDVEEIKRLLERAVLDAGSKKRKAAILDGAIALTKVALKVGLKVAAA